MMRKSSAKDVFPYEKYGSKGLTLLKSNFTEIERELKIDDYTIEVIYKNHILKLLKLDG